MKTTMDENTLAAILFLLDRKPVQWTHISKPKYFGKLLDYYETQGDVLVQSLAGFMVWCEKNDEPDLLANTMAHDFNGMNDDCFVPRSSHPDFWNKWYSHCESEQAMADQ